MVGTSAIGDRYYLARHVCALSPHRSGLLIMQRNSGRDGPAALSVRQASATGTSCPSHCSPALPNTTDIKSAKYHQVASVLSCGTVDHF